MYSVLFFYIPDSTGIAVRVLLVDDKTGWTEVRFLKNKSEAWEKFKEVKNLLERQSGCKVKFLQPDRGGEYIGEKFDDYLKELGIQRRLTVKNTPEQNGIAERKNRTLLDIARCSLIQSKLPLSFWAEAIANANYTKNRLPSKSLQGKSPYELWHGKVPNIGYFKTFGCEAFVWNNKKNRDKFEPRAVKDIFLGYSDNSKAYRVWLTEAKRVEISRSVKFLENNALTPLKEYIDFSPYDDEVIKIDKECQTLRIPAPINSEKLNMPESNDDVSLEPELSISDEPINSEKINSKWGRSRPKLIRGTRGRPWKIYATPQEVTNENNSQNSVDSTDCAIFAMGEISMESALKGESSEDWLKALASEVKSILKHDTFDLVKRTENMKLIGSRFILRNKYGSDGKIKLKKARLVAQGFGQIPEVNYCQNQTFSPVARLSSIRVLASLASKFKAKIYQFDITTAYLNGILEDEVYMNIPKYFDLALETLIESENDEDLCKRAMQRLVNIKKNNMVCKLKKSLYGLKQSGRCWFSRLKEILNNFGLNNTKSDPCVFHMKNNNKLTILTVYVDDILMFSEDTKMVDLLHNHLSKHFNVKYDGIAKNCLGIEFNQTNSKIIMSQSNYIKELLDRFNMLECNTVSTPMALGTKLCPATTPDDKLPYRELIGSLNYLAVCSRPDIAYSISKLSQYLTCYDKSHWLAAKRVLRYLKKTINYGLVFELDDKVVYEYSDSDWGNSQEDRKSYSGYCFMLSNSVISWESRKQKTVALSSTESEYMSLSDSCKEALYLQKLLSELDLGILCKQITINVDNNSAIKLAENSLFHSRTKHIDIRHHFIRDVLEDGKIAVKHVSTSKMGADILTKPLGSLKHYECLKILNVTDLSLL
ncbi:Retrovirus-related Pol polyprotein from transposon TNT 1-94 [Araneus ventricosus]|uniref:Retrovirus-related Pol polyprotein from transposon TNT 1-94 n=1 Tax=Araneus ventricosus TaxID=182803 RepID=A0A4Y2NIA3_ARAVE|nr:Retrovirus-related Pol polyprotein from transposon TNT 1-94 [Araneus ventricosus]